MTEPRIVSSRQIDDRVKDLVHNGLAVYHVDEDKLRDLAPTVIVTQDQCQVCAASLADVEAAVCTWTGTPARIVSHNPNSLADLMRDFRASTRSPNGRATCRPSPGSRRSNGWTRCSPPATGCRS